MAPAFVPRSRMVVAAVLMCLVAVGCSDDPGSSQPDLTADAELLPDADTADSAASDATLDDDTVDAVGDDAGEANDAREPVPDGESDGNEPTDTDPGDIASPDTASDDTGPTDVIAADTDMEDGGEDDGRDSGDAADDVSGDSDTGSEPDTGSGPDTGSDADATGDGDASVPLGCDELECELLGRVCETASGADDAACGECLPGHAELEAGTCTELVEVVAALDAGLTLTGESRLLVAPGASATFTVSPEAGFAVSPRVGGTCPEGVWLGETYTVAALEEHCALHFVAVTPVLSVVDWGDAGVVNDGPHDSTTIVYNGDGSLFEVRFVAGAPAPEDRVVHLHWDWSVSNAFTVPTHMAFFTESPAGRNTVNVYEGAAGTTFSRSGTVSLTLREGERFGVRVYTYNTERFEGSVTLTTLATTPSYDVSATGPVGVGAYPENMVVAQGARPGFTVEPSTGVTLPTIPGGTCAPGVWDGSTYYTGPVTGDCVVDFGVEGAAPRPEGAGRGAGDTGGDEPADGPNQAPTLSFGDGFFFDTDPTYYTAFGWAQLSPGPASEASQQLTAVLEVVDVSGTLTFDSPPTLDTATGNVAWATTPGTFGTATVEVTLTDDGGTAMGGVDTTSAVFEIRVNSPPTAPDVNTMHPWRSPCTPVTYGGADVDLRSVDDDFGEQLYVRRVEDPRSGFLTVYLPRPSRPVGPTASQPDEDYSEWMHIPGSLRSDPERMRATTVCYIPFLPMFTGVDGFTYQVRDNHGGFSRVAMANIMIIEI